MNDTARIGTPTQVSFGIAAFGDDPTVLPVTMAQGLDEPFDDWSKRFTDYILDDENLSPYLEIDREVIRIDFGVPPQEPDPDWRRIDGEGHLHAWVDGKTPTLTWVVDRRWYCEDCQEEHEDGHLACAICGEAIEPGRKPGPTTQLKPGRVSYLLCGQPIAKTDAERVARLLGIRL